MAFDVAIIGAGMSGLAAAIRAGMAGRRTVVLERHAVWGGLNSFFKKGGHHFDTGLHAVTNYLPPGQKGPRGPNAQRLPLDRVFRQLRVRHEDFALDPQTSSRVVFPEATLTFENGLERLTDELARHFPTQVDGFLRLAAALETYPDALAAPAFTSARARMAEHLDDPLLIDMLLCPLLFYGSPAEHDLDADQLSILFNSIYREGFSRPRDGVKTIIRALVRRAKQEGVELRMRSGVASIEVEGGRVSALLLESGERLEVSTVISTAGRVETSRMRSDRESEPPSELAGVLAFTETSLVLDAPPKDLGVTHAITFLSRTPRFRWARPDVPVDTTSAVICCPSNFAHDPPIPQNLLRITHLADQRFWFSRSGDEYAKDKERFIRTSLDALAPFLGDTPRHVTYVDSFTPRTITRYTGHVNGAVYGSPKKAKDGRTDLPNLFLAGTDQGLLGIVGAMVSGISVANQLTMRSARTPDG
ncbi:MAG: NAD(P)/FAD-dependent oxidoreductase [Deltaproteobacteria bacterium]|nr:NAD(P)/FAD-dependent oxidoreductase [Deltaproteobacteria bacterium]